jgi:hypothetical protein
MMRDTMTATAQTKQHSTRRVIAAALVGGALGFGGVSLLSPSPATDVGAVAPVGLSGEVATPEPAATGTDEADDRRTTGADEVAASGATAPTSGVVDQATAEQAAIVYLGEGRVTWVSPEDDHGAAWEIEVTLPTGREVDVYIDASGQVVHTSQGLAGLLP